MELSKESDGFASKQTEIDEDYHVVIDLHALLFFYFMLDFVLVTLFYRYSTMKN